jgi:RHS repeat-associated protein
MSNNHHLRPPIWDDNGNVTARGGDSFAWDVEDRMTSATVGGTATTFAYRGDRLRASRTTGGVTTSFTWDVNAGLPVVLDDGNQYVYGAGLVSQKQGGAWYYYLADGLGSTMAIVDASGAVQNSYTYDVYGKPSKTGSLANEFDFAGQQTDGTGLQYLRARYMDPETGTFISREPMASTPLWLGGHYLYGMSNPAFVTDPTGLWPCPGCGAVKKAAEAAKKAAEAAKNAADDAAHAAKRAADAAIKQAAGVVAATAASLTPPYDPVDILTIIQLVDIVPFTAACAAFGPQAVVACGVAEGVINLVATGAALAQLWMSDCSMEKSMAYIGLVALNTVAGGGVLTQAAAEAALFAAQTAILNSCGIPTTAASGEYSH